MSMSLLRKKFDGHPWRFLITAWTLYIVCFFLIDNFNREPVIWIHSPLDDLIPFSRFAIIPYACWFPLLFIPMILLLRRHDYEDVWNLSMPLFLSMFGSLLFYLIVPNGLNLRPQEPGGHDLFTWLVSFIQDVDTPENVCPSIHVSTTLIIDLTIRRIMKRREHAEGIFFVDLLSASIILSTMFLKQHSVIDVFWGIVTGAAIYLIWNRKQK